MLIELRMHSELGKAWMAAHAITAGRLPDPTAHLDSLVADVPIETRNSLRSAKRAGYSTRMGDPHPLGAEGPL